jgi:hypothetical protein
VGKRFEHLDDLAAPIVDAFVGKFDWRWPSGLVQIRSSLSRLATIDELEALADAARSYYRHRFRLAKVECVVDFPSRPHLAENLRAHTYLRHSARGPTKEKEAERDWRWRVLRDAVGSLRPTVCVRIEDQQRAGLRTVRIAVSCGPGVLKQLNAAAASDLRAVPWDTLLRKWFRVVRMRMDSTRDTPLDSFPKLAATYGLNNALMRFSAAERRQIRRRFEELPRPTRAIAGALYEWKTQLRASGRPLQGSAA